MTTHNLRQELDAMASVQGVIGCALVEIEAGMVWHSSGQIDDLALLAEAASDYWRLYQRLHAHFERLGKLRACAMMHDSGRITLLPCGEGMLLVTVTGQQNDVDWAQWQGKTRQLAKLVDQL